MEQQKTIRINFIKKALDSLPLPAAGKRTDYYDLTQRNLMIRVTSNGSKTFYVRRKIKGQSERILIGRYPDLSVEQARKSAATILSDIALGNNPQENKRRENDEPTLHDLFQNYLNGHARIRCVRVADMEKDFSRYFADWQDRKSSTIHRTDAQSRITSIHRDHGSGGANHALVLMKAVANWNIRHGYINGENPWAGIKAFRMKSRERFLLPDEMTRFFAVLNKLDSDVVRDYIKLSLLTGARQANVLSMRWEDINFDLAVWRIPLTKNGDSHTIPLTAPALAILNERHAKSQSEWVLPGKVPGCHLVEPKRVWHRLLADAKISDLRLHDLRRTLGSYMAIGNQSLQIIGKALGHKSTQATQIYARLTHDPVRKALEQAHADMLAAAGLASDNNVVALPLSDEDANQSSSG
jgi:integrase